MHHLPDRLISVMTQLSLEFSGRECMFRGCEQVHGYEPIAERQFRPLHDRPISQALAVSALLALEHALVGFPVMVRATAFGAYDTLFKP